MFPRIAVRRICISNKRVPRTHFWKDIRRVNFIHFNYDSFHPCPSPKQEADSLLEKLFFAPACGVINSEMKLLFILLKIRIIEHLVI